MDLVATCTIHVPGRLKPLTGRGRFFRTTDIKERCAAIGVEKSKALVGLHNFTGADWGGQFFNVSKKTRIVKFIALAPDGEIVKTFQ